MNAPRVVSGVQTTGTLHLGNYLGAVKNWLDMAVKNYECLFFLADLHAITTYQDPRELRANIRNMAKLLMACGFQNYDTPYGHVSLFRQSDVREHVELQWLLMGTARMGWLNRMTQFKDKGGEGKSVSVGLFAYPVLQAADILLYRPDLVPVGDDQRQHLQLTRDIADKFNADFGPVFKSPEALVPTVNARVMSLQDPMKKMSKSDLNDSSRINLLDGPDLISKKYRAAVADSHTALPSEPAGLDGRVAVGNLVELLAGVRGSTVAEVLVDLAGRGNGALKMALVDATVELLAPIQDIYGQLDDREVMRQMKSNSNRPNLLAHSTIEDVKVAMGLWE